MPNQDIADRIKEASRFICSARYLTAFTGAGISVESGIPPFWDPGGPWSHNDPEKSWPILREIFYDHFGAARPNRAHEVLAAWEARGLLQILITQNGDNLHREEPFQELLVLQNVRGDRASIVRC